MKEKIKSIVFHGAEEWRRWLKLNHNRESEIWLVLPKKSAGGDSYRIYYNQALEEALCFGWIDSRIKPLDETRSLFVSHQGRPRTGLVTTSTESSNW